MKNWIITDAVSGFAVAKVAARDGKTALKRFRESRIMSAGMYEFHQCKGVWVMSSSYGLYFTAREEKM